MTETMRQKAAFLEFARNIRWKSNFASMKGGRMNHKVLRYWSEQLDAKLSFSSCCYVLLGLQGALCKCVRPFENVWMSNWDNGTVCTIFSIYINQSLKQRPSLFLCSLPCSSCLFTCLFRSKKRNNFRIFSGFTYDMRMLLKSTGKMRS